MWVPVSSTERINVEVEPAHGAEGPVEEARGRTVAESYRQGTGEALLAALNV